jgi:hypothetical protein
MVDLVKFLVASLVDNPDLVVVESQPSEGNSELIVIGVAPDDMGRVIGKRGKIISAIRELVKVASLKTGQRVRVTLKDPLETGSDSQSEQSESPSQNSQN